MDLKLYKDAKGSNGVTVARMTADMAVVSTRKFNPGTGAEEDPAFEQFSIKELEKQREVAAEHLASLDEFLADCKKAAIIGPSR